MQSIYKILFKTVLSTYQFLHFSVVYPEIPLFYLLHEHFPIFFVDYNDVVFADVNRRVYWKDDEG